MDYSASLRARIDEALDLIMKRDNVEKPILIISHYDADGITSASIMIKIMCQLEVSFHVKIINQIDGFSLSRIKGLLNKYGLIIMTDLGSGQKSILKDEKWIKGKDLIIIDHHPPQDIEPDAKTFIEVNPRLFGIDGSVEISASGVTYLMARRLSKANTVLAPLAIVGALGDMQNRGEKGRLLGINYEIAKEAKREGLIKEELSLCLFGIHSRPLVECLFRTTNPFLPGLTGNEVACYKFLKEIGIEPEEMGSLRTFSSLSKEEVRRLVTGLIKYMIDAGMPSKEAEKIIGYKYLFLKEDPNSPLYDAQEFATLLNACGRLDKHGLAISVCLGDRERALREALEIMDVYRDKLNRYLKLVLSGDIVENMGEYYCIHGDVVGIEEKIISTIASITAASGLLPEPKPIIALALSTTKEYIKISARLPRSIKENKIDLGKLLREAAQRVGGMGGGHEVAAGAQIPVTKKQDFLMILKEELMK